MFGNSDYNILPGRSYQRTNKLKNPSTHKYKGRSNFHCCRSCSVSHLSNQLVSEYTDSAGMGRGSSVKRSGTECESLSELSASSCLRTTHLQ